MIAEKLDRQQSSFWTAFGNAFGVIGREPECYWTYEVGHVAHVRPCDVALMTPTDLLRSVQFFEAKYG